MRGIRKQCEANVYHIISRGVGRHLIFEDSADRQRYLDLIEEHSKSEGVAIYAWCLMDNHTHLLLRAPITAIASMMKKVNSTYALYYNRRYDHVGHLFQGRYKSEPIQDDKYFLTVLRYIHANPEKAGIVSAAHYQWSSYSEYIGIPKICDTTLALDMLGSTEAFEAFHREADSPLPCLESDTTMRNLDEAQIREIAIYAIGEDALKNIGELPRNERDEFIAKLRKAGLSIRKIERLTGIGRGAIARTER